MIINLDWGTLSGELASCSAELVAQALAVFAMLWVVRVSIQRFKDFGR